MDENVLRKKEDPRCYADRFSEADFTVGRFDHKTMVGITREHLLHPEYWSHVSERMTPYSEVTVRCDDGTYYAKLLVLDCGRGWAKMQVLSWHNLTTSDVAQSQSPTAEESEFEITWKGGNRKYIVQRRSDQQVLHEGELRKDGAEIWLKEYLSGKARKAEGLASPA